MNVNYPPETLHEVITNAVLHRDYAIADDVHIRVFDNRVEVESPGRLPAHITVKNILDERFARNGNIVRLVNRFPDPPNKDVGEGLNTAFAAMRRLRLKDPVIQEREHSVVVQIRHERLASAEEIVLDYLKTNETITNGKARELTGIDSENAMKNVFYRLRDRGLLEQVPAFAGKQGCLAANSEKEVVSAVNGSQTFGCFGWASAAVLLRAYTLGCRRAKRLLHLYFLIALICEYLRLKFAVDLGF